MRILILALFLFVIKPSQGHALGPTQKWWDDNRSTFMKTLDHPFNQELIRGTLSTARYDFYLQQDQMYLVVFAKALAALAMKLDDPQDIDQVLQFARASLVEHKSTPIKVAAQSPANFAYSHFLLSLAATGDRSELAAALLPCFWIYQEVAVALRAKQSLPKNKRYREWIETYSGRSYGADVAAMRALVDKLAQDAQDPLRLEKAFATAMRLELQFWDDAYHRRIQ